MLWPERDERTNAIARVPGGTGRPVTGKGKQGERMGSTCDVIFACGDPISSIVRRTFARTVRLIWLGIPSRVSDGGERSNPQLPGFRGVPPGVFYRVSGDFRVLAAN